MWDRPTSAQAMAASPDGRFLFVIDAGTGLVAVMNSRTLQVRTARIEPASGPIERTTAQMSRDGETLFLATARGGSVVLALDVATLDVVGRWALDGEVSSLGLSADGARLFAAVGGGMAVLDTATGAELGVMRIEPAGDVRSVQAIGD
jgi:DNA-binding beta-propeller fold protein YncE